MSSIETAVSKKVQIVAGKIGSILLRNNRGKFRTLDGKRIVAAGLEAPGSSDLVGVTPVLVTPEMVGCTLGVATFAEVKRRDWTKPSAEHEKDQENFIIQMEKLGAFAFFINDEAVLEKKISESLKKIVDRKSEAV